MVTSEEQRVATDALAHGVVAAAGTHQVGITAVEREIIRDAALGRETNMGWGGNGSPVGRRSVRAAVLRALLCGDRPDWTVKSQLLLRGGVVTGRLDLTEAHIVVPVSLADMVFHEPVVLTDADTKGIRLIDSVLPALEGRRLRCDGDLGLDGIRAAGGVQLQGAVIRGTVRCSRAFLGSPTNQALNIADCNVGGDLLMSSSQVHTRSFPAIDAHHLILGGDAIFEDRFSADSLRLEWAEVHTLRFGGATLTGSAGVTLKGDGLRAARGVFLNDGFSADGTVSLIEADVGAELNCTAGLFNTPHGTALDVTRLTAERVYLNDGFHAFGTVLANGAKIAHRLCCTCGVFTDQTDGLALDLAGVHVSGDVRLDRKFQSVGEVRLSGAKIDRELTCTGGLFNGKGGLSLSAKGLICDGDVYLDKSFHAIGTVDLSGGRFGRRLICSGGRFKGGAGRIALNIEALHCCSDLLLDKGYHATGTVNARHAVVDGQFRCTGGRFDNPAGRSLDAPGIVCHGDVFLDTDPKYDPGRFSASGEIYLAHAEIQHDLRCTDGVFAADAGSVVTATGLSVGGSLFWKPANRPRGAVEFSNASVSRLVDDPDRWPGQSIDGRSLTSMHGLTFKSCDMEVTCQRRLDWLTTIDYAPALYEQFASIYRAAGQESDAKRIEIERLRQRRKRGHERRPTRAWNWFLDITVGYGYRLYRPLLIGLALFVVGFFVFYYAQYNQLMMPTSIGVAADAAVCAPAYPCFSPGIYSLEILLPVVKLWQVNNWIPNASSPSGHLLAGYFWFSIVAGWILTAGVVAGIGQILNRTDK